MNNGKQNEYDFVLMLNGKKVKELDPNSYDMIHAIFNNISDNNIIKSWKNHYKQKTDVMIKINNIIKGISIKMGSRNSVHVEPLSSFIKFLENNEIPINIIDIYLKYHFADGTNDGTGKNRMSVEEYKHDIKLINNFLYEKKRYCVQIKWYSLFDDIILNMYLKSLTNQCC